MSLNVRAIRLSSSIASTDPVVNSAVIELAIVSASIFKEDVSIGLVKLFVLLYPVREFITLL